MDVIHVMACFTVFSVCYPILIRDRLAVNSTEVSILLAVAASLVWAIFDAVFARCGC